MKRIALALSVIGLSVMASGCAIIFRAPSGNMKCAPGFMRVCGDVLDKR